MIVAILQARMSSSRLPGKVTKKILNEEMIGLQIQRVKKSKEIDQVILATSLSPEDDKIEAVARKHNVNCFRGSLNDVMDRFFQAVKTYDADTVVRLTGDCPLMDHELIDQMIQKYQDDDLDYITNTLEPSYPDGFDIWVFKSKHLHKAQREATLPSEREHVTTYLNNNVSDLKFDHLKSTDNNSHLRLTVDEVEDFELITKVFDHFGNIDFRLQDVLDFLKINPDIASLNQKYNRDEGLEKSLANDTISFKPRIRNIKKSLAIQDKASSLIAGTNHLLSKRVDQYSRGTWPGYFSSAKGSYVWDLDGNEYLDMSIGGIGATVLGYADPEVEKEVIHANLNGVASSLNAPQEIELAQEFINDHPWAEKVRYTKTGGEAMTVAIRIGRSSSKKDKIALCGYHGWHDWYLASNLFSDGALDGHLLPGLSPSGVPRALAGTSLTFRYNDIASLENVIEENPGEIGVIVLEPTRNDPPKDGFLEKVKEIANKIGATLIFDEISAGYRLCCGGSHKLFNVEPDIAVFSKAIGNGHPIAAIIGKDNVMDSVQDSFISSTCWTERSGLSAAISTIRKFREENVHEILIENGTKIQKGWNNIANKHGIGIHVGGIAPLSHFTFDDNHLELKAYFIQEMLDRGILASNIYYAMYAHNNWNIKYYLKACDEVFAKISKLIKDKQPIPLRGEPAKAGFARLN